MRILVVVLGVSIAHAKPLPPGMTVVMKNDHLYVVKGGVSVPLFDDQDPRSDVPYSEPKNAQLSADGKLIQLEGGSCLVSEDGLDRVPLAVVEARFENVTGMGFHLKKQYADAIAHFAAAVKADPDTPLLATNLLSAQSLGGKLEDADRTLALFGPKNPAWFGWRLAVDSDLVPLRGRPSTKPFVAKPTKLVLDDNTGAAISPLGVVAISEGIYQGMGMGSGSASYLALYDLAQNRLLLRLPLVSPADACFVHPPKDVPPGAVGPPCTKDQLAHTSEHRRVASAIVGSLGMTKLALQWTQITETTTAIALDKTHALALSDTAATVTKGKQVTTLNLGGNRTRQVGWGGGVLVVVHHESYQCGGADSQEGSSDVIAVP